MRINASIPIRKIAAGSDTYERGFHRGDPGGLDAIDSELVTANIKNGIVIFGKSGSADVRDIGDADAGVGDVKDPKTFYAVSGGKKTGILTLALIYDTEGTHWSTSTSNSTNWPCEAFTIPSGGDHTYFTKTLTCAQATVLFGFAAGTVKSVYSDTAKLRLFIDGVQVAETGFWSNQPDTYILIGHRNVSSGARITRLDGHNYHGSLAQALVCSGGVGAGCPKT